MGLWWWRQAFETNIHVQLKYTSKFSAYAYFFNSSEAITVGVTENSGYR